jgi:hypothetical protein
VAYVRRYAHAQAGRWRALYRLSGRPGSYPIRVRIRRQRNLPYATGYSKRVTVHARSSG